MTATYPSDAYLEARIESAKDLGLPTRYDETLLSVHVDDRIEASAAAHTMLNMAMDAGRPSDALAAVVSDFRRAA